MLLPEYHHDAPAHLARFAWRGDTPARVPRDARVRLVRLPQLQPADIAALPPAGLHTVVAGLDPAPARTPAGRRLALLRRLEPLAWEAADAGLALGIDAAAARAAGLSAVEAADLVEQVNAPGFGWAWLPPAADETPAITADWIRTLTWRLTAVVLDSAAATTWPALAALLREVDYDGDVVVPAPDLDAAANHFGNTDARCPQD